MPDTGWDRQVLTLFRCERCGVDQNVDHSELLGVTLCGNCFGSLADEIIASTRGTATC
jgi:transcription elongation factor Elf1